MMTFYLSGLVMGLQFRHQQTKLYREVAMGEKHLLSITRGKVTSHAQV